MNLGDVIQYAMDRLDRPVLEATTGRKNSIAWWTRMVNAAQSVLAQNTGYRLKRFPLTVTQYTQFTALPSTLCWGIKSVCLGNEPLDLASHEAMDEEYPGWRNQSNFPNQPNNDNVEVLSSSAADKLSLTIKGSAYSTGAYATEQVVLNGTTQVSPTTTTAWGEIYYAEVTDSENWEASTAYTSGEIVNPTSGSTTQRWRCTTPGTSGATEPSWPASPTAGTTTQADGTATWTYEGIELAGDVTIREASANATIATIEAGETSVGEDISANEPTTFIIEQPNILWYPIPDESYTAWMLAGELPADFATPASLAAATDALTSLPAQFHYVLGEGTATIAAFGELSLENEQVRASESGKAFWNGIAAVNEYLANLSRGGSETMLVDMSQYEGNFK